MLLNNIYLTEFKAGIFRKLLNMLITANDIIYRCACAFSGKLHSSESDGLRAMPMTAGSVEFTGKPVCFPMWKGVQYTQNAV